jgi:hypothetical protein
MLPITQASGCCECSPRMKGVVPEIMESWPLKYLNLPKAVPHSGPARLAARKPPLMRGFAPTGVRKPTMRRRGGFFQLVLQLT